MKKIIYFIISIVLGFLFNTEYSYASGPFGVNMGDKIESFNNLKRIPNISKREFVETFITNSLPNGIPDLSKYYLEFGPKGLISVIGEAVFEIDNNTKNQYNSRYWCTRSQLFESIKNGLLEKYGNSTKNNLLDSDIYGTDPNHYLEEWWLKNNENYIDFIFLSADRSGNICKIKLDYNFINSSTTEKDMKEVKSGKKNKKIIDTNKL